MKLVFLLLAFMSAQASAATMNDFKSSFKFFFSSKALAYTGFKHSGDHCSVAVTNGAGETNIAIAYTSSDGSETADLFQIPDSSKVLAFQSDVNHMSATLMNLDYGERVVFNIYKWQNTIELNIEQFYPASANLITQKSQNCTFELP